jgi:hypothetical protein
LPCLANRFGFALEQSRSYSGSISSAS